MAAMDETPDYKVENGKIYGYIEPEYYYDVDWGNCVRGGYWIKVADDTPENRKRYGL